VFGRYFADVGIQQGGLMAFDLSLETQGGRGWDHNQLPPSPESVSVALDKLAEGVIGTIRLGHGAEELWASGGPQCFNVWAVTGPDHFFDLVGDRHAKGSRELVVGGQTSEVPARHCVTKNQALQAFWGFLASGHLELSDDKWERQGSHADPD
jgi:hypothetical protein